MLAEREELEDKCVLKRSLKNSTVDVWDLHCSAVSNVSMEFAICCLSFKHILITFASL